MLISMTRFMTPALSTTVVSVTLASHSVRRRRRRSLWRGGFAAAAHAHCETRVSWKRLSWKARLTPTTRLTCSNAAKTRKPLKLEGVPQTRQQISGVSSLKFTILREHVDEVSAFTRFFPIVDTCLSCEDIARQSCAMVH